MAKAPLALPDYQQVQLQLEEDIATCRQLLTVLDNEHQALTSHDKNTINEALTQKQELMMVLERHALQRQQWLRQAYPQHSQALESEQSTLWRTLLQVANLPVLTDLWETLETCLKDCKTRNETNGKVIARSQQTVKKLINILRGQSIDGPKLYTARGDTRAQSYSHSFTKA